MLDAIKKALHNLTAKPLDVHLRSLPIIKHFYAQITNDSHDADKQQKTLTRAYVSAFTLIAFFSLGDHFLSVHINNNQRENAEVTFALTNTRALVDSIVTQAGAFKSSGDNFDDDRLTASITKLRQEHVRILSDDVMGEIFESPSYALGAHLSAFEKKTEEFLRAKRTAQHEAIEKSYTDLTGETSKILEINLDKALDGYHDNVISQIETSSRLQNLGVLLVLLVLGLEALFIFRPLTQQLGEYHKHLIKMALTDFLTGVNNRRAFITQANQGLDLYRRHKTPFCLVLMDLDKFKSINDTYGHKTGDLVLQHYAKLMQKHMRTHDTLGRLGGEEFAIFLPQTSADEALTIIERFRKLVAETPCPYVDGNGEKKTLNYTSSFGIVGVSTGTWTLDELLIRADENLYKAKEQGRNRVILEIVQPAAA